MANRDAVVANRISALLPDGKDELSSPEKTVQQILAQISESEKRWLTLLNDPRMQRLTKERAHIDVRIRYRAILAQLGLSDEKRLSLEDLLTENLERLNDVRVVAVSLKESMTSHDILALLAGEKRQLESEELGLLGPETFKQLQILEDGEAERKVITDLAETLFFSANPLTADQRTRLFDLLKTSRVAATSGSTSSPIAFDRDRVRDQSSTFLSPLQLAELESSLADARFRTLQADYITMLQGWIQQKTPATR